MDCLKSYIKSRMWKLAGLFALQLVWCVALWLQGTEITGIAYAFLLEFALVFIFGVLDFIIYFRKWTCLTGALNSVPHDLPELPETISGMEALYQKIVSKLYLSERQAESEFRMSRQDMLDYYSLWGHQIKTPISGMRLLLQSQPEGQNLSEEEQRNLTEWMQRLSIELFRVDQYVEMVLSYLRMEDMGKDLVLAKYQAEKLARQAVKKFSKDFLYRKIRLEFADFTLEALTDEKWLMLVLEQVLSNALKYTEEGGCIRIYADEKRKILTIEDTGIGIRSEDLPRVCEKGFTGYNGRENKKSTGIGLYLCKSIMDKLNHGFMIESEEGKGTKVMLYLGREERRME